MLLNKPNGYCSVEKLIQMTEMYLGQLTKQKPSTKRLISDKYHKNFDFFKHIKNNPNPQPRELIRPY